MSDIHSDVEKSSLNNQVTLKLFEAHGVEIEYIIVDRDSLEICPIADTLLKDDGNVVNEVSHGEITWCNELARHLIEFNFSSPEKTLLGKEKLFNKNITLANSILKNYNAMLMPTGMHPFLNPSTANVQLWPFELSEIFITYDKIFNCKNHGWINLQSVHLNLPFSGEEEFKKLHSAIRYILPIIPALSASSPIVEGRPTLKMDSRLGYYQNNQSIIPEIGAEIIPEIINSTNDYKTLILNKMYQAVSPHDPGGILQFEWLNSRGAIVRFDRSAIEIRIIDSQECATADFAVLQIISSVIKWMIKEKENYFDEYHNFNLKQMVDIFNHCIQEGDQALIENTEYLKIFNFKNPVTAREIWSNLFDLLYTREEKKAYHLFVEEYKVHGSLASRIIKAAGNNPDKNTLIKIYRELSYCLSDDKIFTVE
ncbi:MAG: glutamate-cysteine ligase family protein [Spirochaetia bacterium]|nr:glutamate-cysteine ligase family protein [Spirochaetia bacterium]